MLCPVSSRHLSIVPQAIIQSGLLPECVAKGSCSPVHECGCGGLSCVCRRWCCVRRCLQVRRRSPPFPTVRIKEESKFRWGSCKKCVWESEVLRGCILRCRRNTLWTVRCWGWLLLVAGAMDSSCCGYVVVHVLDTKAFCAACAMNSRWLGIARCVFFVSGAGLPGSVLRPLPLLSRFFWFRASELSECVL